MSIYDDMNNLFEGLDRAHGEFVITGQDSTSGKVNGKALTLLEPVTDELWRMHLKGERGLGIIPIRSDNTCKWAVIDIDDNDIDHKALCAKTKDMPVVVCRSKSGGAHVFMFFKKALPASIIRVKLSELADALGHPGAEVFPKQSRLLSDSDVGNWLNIPYFDSERTLRYALKNGKSLTLEKFIAYANEKAIDEDQFNDFKIEIGAIAIGDGPPCLAKLCAQGIAKGDGRNIVLFSLGVYCRDKFGSKWESKLEEFNTEYMTPALPSREVVTIIKSLGKKKYYYRCNEQPLIAHCNKMICKKREYGIGGDDSEPSFVLGTLTKIDSDPPVWFINVDGVRVELSTDDLLSQARFRKLCVERINKLPRKLKAYTWERLISEKLSTLDLVQAPIEASPRGQFEYLVERFLTRSPGRSEGQLLSGKVFIDDGRALFRGPDLMDFLQKSKFYDFKQRKVWSTLRDMGAKHTQRHIKGKCVQVWSLPLPKVQIEEYDVPEIEREDPF